MRLVAEPEIGLVDEPVSWRVDGLEPGSAVQLHLRTSDAANRQWQSQGIYGLDEEGGLVIEDGDSPWTGMRLLDADTPPTTFTAPVSGSVVSAEATAGEQSARTEVRRLYARDVDEGSRSGDGWMLRTFVPRGASRPLPGVMMVGGSTGMGPMLPRAALLASRGFATAVLGYMQEPGLPRSLDRIPVEVLTAALEAFSEADRDRIAVWAASVGNALTLAALADPAQRGVAAVIAVAPTDVVWQSFGAAGPPPKRSMLTRAGREIPWLAMRGELVLGQMARNIVVRRLPGRARSTALTLHAVFARARQDTAALDRASIAVELIDSPMLLIAGDADAMWPSATMASRIADRRKSAGVGDRDQMLLLPDAGHFFALPGTPSTVDRNLDLVSGGTPDGNAAAQRQAWDAAITFLQHTLR